MALIPCFECKKEIGSTVDICPQCGTNQIKLKKLIEKSNELQNLTFWNECSLYGFLFGSLYYAGYGKMQKAIVMLILSFIPLGIFAVAIYCGKNAKYELPIGLEEFKWGNVFIIIILSMIGFYLLNIFRTA